ncbi:MAG: hypothetical protein JNJ54_14990 [Myxococcaceae bacterium]|nr:hypothetical protein [Myxococcaceae bacterium]
MTTVLSAQQVAVADSTPERCGSGAAAEPRRHHRSDDAMTTALSAQQVVGASTPERFEVELQQNLDAIIGAMTR